MIVVAVLPHFIWTAATHLVMFPIRRTRQPTETSDSSRTMICR